MDTQVSLLLEEVFPGRDVRSVDAAGPSWNENNRTLAVEFADGERSYLKCAIDGDGSRIERERAVIAYVSATASVRTPAILACDSNAALPYLVTAPLSGQSLFESWEGWSDSDRATMTRAVGRALATIHEARFDEHGLVTGGGADALEIRMGSWTDVLFEKIRYLRTLAISDRFDHFFDEALVAVEANRAVLDDAPAVLLHGDPTRGNCFRGADGVGFVDWEDAYVGDPVRELRRARRQLIEPVHVAGSERVIDALYDGYREQAGELPAGFADRCPIYDVTSFLDTAGFFETWAPDADEPTDDLAAWVDEEMRRRLAVLE